jgi:squalene cyclase
VGTGTFAGPSPRSGDDIIRLFPFAADRKKMETESLGSAGLALFQTWGLGWVRRLVEKPQVWESHQPFATAHLSGAPLGLS